MSYIRGLSDDEIEIQPGEVGPEVILKAADECRAQGVTEKEALNDCVRKKLNPSPFDALVGGFKDLVSVVTSPFTGGDTTGRPPPLTAAEKAALLQRFGVVSAPVVPGPGGKPIALPKPTILGLPRTVVLVGAVGLGAVLLLGRRGAAAPAPTANPRRRRRRWRRR